MRIMGRHRGRWRAGEGMKARTLSRRTRRICCGTSPYLLFHFFSSLSLSSFFLVPSCLPFSQFFARRATAGSPETTTTYSEKRQPVFHAVSPFCLPAASRDSFPSFSPPWPPRRRKTSRRACEFKGTLRSLRPPRGCGKWRPGEEKERSRANQCSVNSFHRY